MKRIIAAVLVGAILAFSLAACFGSFKATRTVYGWNNEMPNKWAKTLVMWAFSILPVYLGAFLIDGLIFNLIEFWEDTGPNAMTVPLKDGALAELTRVDAQTVHVKTIGTDGTSTELSLVRVGERAVAVKDGDGNVLSQVEIRDDGTLALTADGKTRVVPMRGAEEAVRLGLDPSLALGAVR